MHVLLIEPRYYTTYPPLGLLKISAYHKSLGDSAQLVRGCRRPVEKPDRIYVTSLFTWSWKTVWETVRYYKNLFPQVELWLGGLYASLLPRHAALCGADRIHEGLFGDAENLMPDYGLVPRWNGSIIFSSRGCIRKCAFCAVPKLEGDLNSVKHSIKHLIYPKHTKIIFWDNNILASPSWRAVFDELEDLNMTVDFNQGLDARLITDDVVERLGRLKLSSGSGIKVRLGYDSGTSSPFVQKAIEKLTAGGIRGREIMVYVLYNYDENPEDFFERVRNVLNWGAVAYPMRYEPLNSLEKGKHVGPRWDRGKLEMVTDSRRVIGYGGAFPPYGALIRKFRRARCFDEAFRLRPVAKKRTVTVRRASMEKTTNYELTKRKLCLLPLLGTNRRVKC